MADPVLLRLADLRVSAVISGRHKERIVAETPAPRGFGSNHSLAAPLRHLLEAFRTAQDQHTQKMRLPATRGNSPHHAGQLAQIGRRVVGGTGVVGRFHAWRAAEGDRSEALGAARYAVWAYFVQRELIGFRRHTDVIQDLDIPAIVLNGLGEAPPSGLRRRR